MSGWLGKSLGVLFAVAAIAGPAKVAGQAAEPAVVYLVRHAETEPDGTRDPLLSAEGERRAERLARMLSAAGLTGIHTTPYQRTRATAAEVAEAVGVRPREYDPNALQAFAQELLQEGGRHLVVGHSNTTPALVAMIGGEPGGPIPEDEYGRVYQLTLGPDGVRTAILGYPGGWLADPPASDDQVPTADPADVETVDALIAALYDVISGPAGEPRDWDRLRSLFLPTARMVPVQHDREGRTVYRAITVDEYIHGSGPMLEQIGFREREIARRVERFGDVAHVFSTYEGHQEGQAEPVTRGLNSIQLIHDGDRWWVSSLAWSPERPDLPIPPRYREDSGG